MVDSDQDGVDDLLEVRYGTSAQNADSDGDTIPDFEEIVLGLNPTVADNPQALGRQDPGLRIEVYSSGPDLVLEVAVMRRNNARDMRLFWATAANFHEVRLSSLASMPNDRRTFAAVTPGFTLDVYRLQLPTAFFLNQPAVAVAVKGRIDGTYYADQIQLSSMTGALMEWRPATNNSLSSQSGGGGLFPTDPGGQVPGEVRPGEVCIQTLTPVGSLGGGQMLYQVADSYCGYMPGAVCFSGCPASVGDSVIGIDIIGLLAN